MFGVCGCVGAVLIFIGAYPTVDTQKHCAEKPDAS